MKTQPDSLHQALAELATTMSPNPDRLRQIRQRVEQRRRRRMATGAAVSAGAVAAAVGIAMVPREPRSPLQFGSAASPLPECASVLRPVPHVPTTTVSPKSPAPVTTTDAPTATADPDIVGGYKGYGAVTARGDGTLTIANFQAPGLLPPSEELDVIVDSTTIVEHLGHPGALADIVFGRRVAFAVTVRAGERNHLDYLEINAEDVPDPSLRADPAPDGTREGKGVIDSVPAAGQLLVLGALGNGDKETLRLVVGPDTRYFRFDTECEIGEPVAGASILFAARPNDDGTYSAIELRIYD